MRNAPSNPARNQIPAGITEENLLKGIEKSGYPLQGVVVTKLKKAGFTNIGEEWGFVDKGGGQSVQRTLDAFAIVQFAGSGQVVPGVSLLVECKRSDHPYVFFRRVNPTLMGWFPHVGPIGIDGIELSVNDGSRSRIVSPSMVLGLNELPFCAVAPPEKAGIFSRAVPKGEKVELSGEEPFNKIMLPLMRASDALLEIDKLNKNAKPIRLLVTLCVAVVDGPMILVDTPMTGLDPQLCPWVRVVRQESNPQNPSPANKLFRYYAVDVVHIDFLEEFLRDHVLPFGHEFARRSVVQSEVLIRGGKVSDTQNWKWDQIAAR